MSQKGLRVRFANRRDMCHFIGKRARLLTRPQAADAWAFLGRQLEAMGEMDLPKFSNLISTIRTATIAGKLRS